MIKHSLVFLSALFLSSCSLQPYYQFFTVDAERAEETNNSLTFSDNACSLVYNLWGPGGNAQFKFKNNSETDLIILKNQSFWVLNGQAFPMYQGRVWVNAQSQSLGFNTGTQLVFPKNTIDNVSRNNSYMASVERIEPTEQRVPAGQYAIIESEGIHYTVYEKCKVMEDAAVKTPINLSFNAESSPLKFQHLIRYTNGRDTFEISSNFHVKQITTLRERDAVEDVLVDPCGDEAADYWGRFRRLKYLGPATFYLKFDLD
jgi:hypothetical protein